MARLPVSPIVFRDACGFPRLYTSKVMDGHTFFRVRTVTTLGDITEDGPPEGYGIRVKGGRTIYAECGSMWRPKAADGCYVSRLPFGAYATAYQWERKLRFLPSDTPIELVPLSTEPAS